MTIHIIPDIRSDVREFVGRVADHGAVFQMEVVKPDWECAIEISFVRVASYGTAKDGSRIGSEWVENEVVKDTDGGI